jgi:hypothetical protein
MSDTDEATTSKKKRHECIVAKHDVVKVKTSNRVAVLCQTCNKWIGGKK